jgi:Domain of Unknown Function (DUF1080)/PA14 domain
LENFSSILLFSFFHINKQFQQFQTSFIMFVKKINKTLMVKLLKIILSAFLPLLSIAQTTINLENLDAFTTKSTTNWSIVGNVSADFSKANQLTTQAGKGVLACTHEVGKYGVDFDLFSTFQHGDIDVSFDFMMAAGSNSGLYFMERYELQLFDSWGKLAPKYADCGGIYERWNDTKPEGQNGYEGIPPRVNACKAPGLWQHLDISFQAPRFDAAGNKISNAKFLSVTLNGQLIHENVDVTGTTRGGKSGVEEAMGKLRFQGDHGSLAFRNIKYTNFDKPKGSISNLNHKVYYGNYAIETDLQTLKVDERGTSQDLTWEVSKNPNDFVIVIKGTYTAATAGKHIFDLYAGGHAMLKLDNKNVINNNWNVSSNKRSGPVELTAGDHPFEITINKRDAWVPGALGLYSSGPGFRATPHHALGSLLSSKPTDPILIQAKTNTILRSFMDVPGVAGKSHRITHAVSVGTPEQMHYTYDLDAGSLVQVWRGGFLDATPMWNDRGDGSSKPLSAPISFGIQPDLFKENKIALDTIGTGYKPVSYVLDEQDIPLFTYIIYGLEVKDKTYPEGGKMLRRDVTFNGENINFNISEGKLIEKISETLYAVNDKSYFIKINEGVDVKILDNKTLIASPKNKKISYSILF